MSKISVKIQIYLIHLKGLKQIIKTRPIFVHPLFLHDYNFDEYKKEPRRKFKIHSGKHSHSVASFALSFFFPSYMYSSIASLSNIIILLVFNRTLHKARYNSSFLLQLWMHIWWIYKIFEKINYIVFDDIIYVNLW